MLIVRDAMSMAMLIWHRVSQNVSIDYTLKNTVTVEQASISKSGMRFISVENTSEPGCREKEAPGGCWSRAQVPPAHAVSEDTPRDRRRADDEQHEREVYRLGRRLARLDRLLHLLHGS